MLKKTKNIAMVQKMLGHSNITTTLRYAHIDDQDLLDAVNI
jgi:site-specific recombinase XerD